jgi:two-component system, NtrC family, response regulator HydG
MPSRDSVKRVLVVDDLVEMAETIVEDLRDLGYDGLAVSSGERALRVLETQRIDVLITDVRMPGIDGLDLLRSSLELDPSRPVILMTGYATLGTAVAATGRGAFHYLTKPFRLDALIRVLDQALAR